MPNPTSQKTHAVTTLATAAVARYRFVGFDGAHATTAGGAHDAQGVSEQAAAVGQLLSLTTSYSAPVEAAEAIPALSYVKPAADGSGRAVVGSAGANCGRALSAAGAAGELLEVRFREPGSFSGAPSAGDDAFTSAGVEATIVVGATPTWLAAGGYTKALISPSTAGEGVRFASGLPSVGAGPSDLTIPTGTASVLSISRGLALRRSGANDCTVNVVLGTGS